MTPDQEIRRGQDAAVVLDNPIYQEAMQVLRGQMMEQFQNTSYDQSEERDEIWRTLRCLNGLEAQLEAVMTTGRVGAASKGIGGAPH